MSQAKFLPYTSKTRVMLSDSIQQHFQDLTGLEIRLLLEIDILRYSIMLFQEPAQDLDACTFTTKNIVAFTKLTTEQ